MTKRAILFANGSLADPDAVRRFIVPGDILLAADGGTRHALSLGLVPSLIIGDLDSLAADDRQKAEAAGARLLEYPADKNETDLELALAHALREGFRKIIVVGAAGGRLDQTLANLALLTDPRLSTLDVRLDDGVEEAFFIRSRGQVTGAAGDAVSLLPWGGPVAGVVTRGLRWPLRGETLLPDRTRGVSNELLGRTASVSIESGLLLVVHRRSF